MPLRGVHTPEQALLALRGDQRPFALTGAWAGGGAIVGSEPIALAGPRDDPFAVLDDQPAVRSDAQGARGTDAVGGGWFGYLGYALGALIERVPPAPPRPVPVAAHGLAFYDHLLRRDASGQWWFEALWSERAERRLTARLDRLRERLAAPAPEPRSYRCSAFRPRPQLRGHAAAVRACAEGIRAGELYQANLTVRLEASFRGEALDLFVCCAHALKPPYAAFVGGPDSQVASLSPELFLARRGREVHTTPIKGTAPRTGDGASLERLLASGKDRAENVMIVDLMRNDLGRVCEPGSVHVASLALPEAHPGVWHLVSRVRGRLAHGVSDGDLLRAAFPPGSVTGAPKVKAMEVIARLESTGREVYTGAIGFASPVAGMELNVAIRTFEVAGDAVWLGAGGGIVADSDPEAEYHESIAKARPLLAAAGASLAAPAATASDPGVPDPPIRHPRPDPAVGILETVAVLDGRALELGLHLERLRRSAAVLYGQAAAEEVDALARRARDAAARTTGVRRLRLGLAPGRPPWLETLPVPGEGVFPRHSLTLQPITVPGGLGAHKWADRRLLRDAAAGAGGAEPLLVDLDGAVLESGSGNLFVVDGGTVLTPPLDGRQLPGVTRAIVLELCDRAGIEAREGSLDLRALATCDEVLVTSAIRGLQPARLRADRPPEPPPESVCARLAELLAARWRLAL